MKNIFDTKHVKNVKAWALLHKGTDLPAGKMVANFSDNPGGAVCTATLIIYSGKLKNSSAAVKDTARAGGYGYDKLADCLSKILGQINFGGTETAIQYLEKHGYTVIEVL